LQFAKKPTAAEDAIRNVIDKLQKRFMGLSNEYKRLILIELIRTIDFAAFAFCLAPNRVELQRSDEARHYMLLGGSIAVQPLLASIAGDPGGVPWGPSREELTDIADQYLLTCGQLAHIRRFVELERYGLAKATLINPKHLILEVTPDPTEQEERDSNRWLEPDLSVDDSVKISETELLRRLDNYIAVHEGWYIRYDPDLESFSQYQHIARNDAARCLESSELPAETILGNRSFKSWNEAAALAQARVLHHIACVTRLKSKEPSLDLRNLLTCFARKDDMIDVLIQAGEDRESATLLMSMLTLDSKMAETYDLHNDILVPFYIDFGADFVLLPCFGALLNPYACLSWQLKRRFRRDWDSGVDKREHVFRIDLKKLLSDARFVVPDKGFKLRRPSGEILTDVDASILDSRTGSLVLVQLKWHDIYGRSLKQRDSRKRNLLSANDWVERVSSWVQARSSHEIARALNIGEASFTKPPMLLILTRHSARFTAVNSFDSRAAWVGWAQFAQAVRTTIDADDPLTSIFELFRAGGYQSKDSSREINDSFRFSDFVVDLKVR